jgi:hypothetical protein
MSAPTTASPSHRTRGRPPSCSRELAVRVISLRRQGLSLAQICIVLNAHDIPTPSGRPFWQKSYIDRLLRTRYVQDIIESGGWDQSAISA